MSSLKTDWWKYLAGAIISIITVLVPLYFNNFFITPTLTWEQTEPMPITANSVLIATDVRNTGLRLATEVRLKIRCNGDISNINYISSELVSYIKENSDCIIFTIDRMLPNTKDKFYIQVFTNQNDPVQEVSLSSNEVKGKMYKQIEPILSTNYVVILMMISLTSTMIFAAYSTIKRIR